MASTQKLRRRIKSIKNTAQITKAMEMVAATKMRKAQNQALFGRPYNINLDQSLKRLLPRIEKESHALISANSSENIGVAIFSTDKGLVGALNTNVIRTVIAASFPQKAIFYTVGRKGRQFVVRTGKNLKADFENPAVIAFRQAKQLSKMLIDSYLSGEIGEVYLIYPKFVSTLRQEATKVKLLPISISDIVYGISERQNDTRLTINDKQSSEFIIEPSSQELLNELLIHYVEITIYQALLETKASEHSAQMIAMKNATENAEELVGDLQLTYNQTRQGNITSELLEITSAQAAME